MKNSLSRPFAVLALVLAWLAGCTVPPAASGSATGAMRLSLALPLEVPADVARVTVTVSGADIASRSTELVLTEGVWGGVLQDIPAGERRTFLAQAFTSTGTLRYQGSATDVPVTAGSLGLVSLFLQDVPAPSPLANEAPVVESVVASSSSVFPGHTLFLQARVRDPDRGDTVSYAWTASEGSFSAPTQARTAWTAPSRPGGVDLFLRVSDSRGAAFTVRVEIEVSTGNGNPARWTPTGSLGTARATPTLTLLPSGEVLATGGSNGYSLTSVDRYDPATGTWRAAWPLTWSRNGHTATLLSDGRVLIVGGFGYLEPQTVGEVYNPVTDTWRHTGLMQATRLLHTATLLADGRVLVAGGRENRGEHATAEVYDPATNTWSATGSMSVARSEHTATRLPDGRVLVAGGRGAGQGTAELYDPATGTWSATGSLISQREAHTATLLSGGRVLIAGGKSNVTLKTAEVYEPSTGTWRATNALTTARFGHTATRLPDGRVLVTGGMGAAYDEHLATSEVYESISGTWTRSASLSLLRAQHAAVLLSTGKVLVVGGVNGGEFWSSAELYEPYASP